MSSKARFSDLKKDEWLSETTYYKVEKIAGKRVQVKAEGAKEPIVLDSDYVDNMLVSGTQFDTEEKINQTEMAEKFLAAVNVIQTVSFNKKVDDKEVLRQIMETHSSSAPKDVEKNFKKTIKVALEGQERILTGFHYGSVDGFGRVQVTDLNVADGGNKGRLVDPRTINWLILRGVKYIVK